ncbi:MAG: hypothetical protein K2R98_09430 [Gemmataceae bacterium]|nr:hypothetical protein [Gemmataceae bacterium]
MARNIFSRLRLTGTLVTGSPLHVGGHGNDVESDLPLARDGAGQLYVPGTSLAGALRRWCEQAFDEPAASYDDGAQRSERTWGYQARQSSQEGLASLVSVDDLVIENSVNVEVRDGVGIDRRWGAAAKGVKYDRAILPRGTRMALTLTVDVERSENRPDFLGMLAGLKQALEQGRIHVGAARTRGLGSVRLQGGELTEQVFGTREGILALLRQSAGAPVSSSDIEQARAKLPARLRPRLELKISWTPVGPLMVKAGYDGIAVDMLPLTSGIDGQLALVLPGSSIKGACRSQAERIVRTLLGINLPENFLDDIKDPRTNNLCNSCRTDFQSVRVSLDGLEIRPTCNCSTYCYAAPKLPLIDELFGQRGERNKDSPADTLRSGLGAVRVSDCYGERRLPQELWQSIQSAHGDVELRTALHAAGLQPWAQAYHVAIDRWLGSAAESMLYSVLEPHRVAWEPLTLELDLERLPEALHEAAIALVLLVVRDLAQHRLPLGFGTNRGMGSVQVDSVQLNGEGLPESLAALNNITLPNGRLGELPTGIRDRLNRAWQVWIARPRQEATT